MKYRRIMAFIIDMFIVSLLVGILSSNKFTNPYLEQYESYQEEYQDVYKSAYSDLMSDNDYKMFFNKINDSVYKINKYGLYYKVYYLAICILYFGVIQYIYGQTIGKKFMKLKIVNEDGNDISINKLVLRTFINGCDLFYGVNICVLLNLLLLAFKDNFAIFYIVLSSLSLVIEIGFVITLLVKKDDRLLNDIIFHTKVVEYN